MSVEKVDAYREQKKHRKENLAKERRNKKLTKLAGWLILLVLVLAVAGGIALTGWNQYKAYAATIPDYSVTEQVINDYTGVTSLDETEEAEEDTAEDETAEEETEAAETEAAETEAAETEAQ